MSSTFSGIPSFRSKFVTWSTVNVSITFSRKRRLAKLSKALAAALHVQLQSTLFIRTSIEKSRFNCALFRIIQVTSKRVKWLAAVMSALFCSFCDYQCHSDQFLLKHLHSLIPRPFRFFNVTHRKRGGPGS